MSAPEVLIVGTSRNVGRYLVEALGGRAVPTFHRTPVPGGVRLDVLEDRIEPILDAFPSVNTAVLLFGETNPDRCIADPVGSQRLNVDATLRIAATLDQRGVRVVFFSSQFIFDGTRGGYTEEDPPSPILLYGKQKVEVETHLLAHVSNPLILRLSKAVGDRPGDGTLFPNWLEQLAGGPKRLRCATDQIQTPVFIPDIVRAVEGAIDHGLSGVYHLAGPDSLARTELLGLLLEEWQARGGAPVEIEPCGINDFDLPEPRPLDVSMDSSRLAAELRLCWTPMKQVASSSTERFFSAG